MIVGNAPNRWQRTKWQGGGEASVHGLQGWAGLGSQPFLDVAYEDVGLHGLGKVSMGTATDCLSLAPDLPLL